MSGCPQPPCPDFGPVIPAVEYTAQQLRDAYVRVRGTPITVVWPFNPPMREQFIREQREHETAGGPLAFDWSQWPVEQRPGGRLSAEECAAICDRVNARLARGVPGV